jgi:rRNA maturation protein Nop10
MMTEGKTMQNETQTPREDNRVTLQCNECGKKRKVSPEGTFNDRCPKCGGVDWDVL